MDLQLQISPVQELLIFQTVFITSPVRLHTGVIIISLPEQLAVGCPPLFLFGRLCDVEKELNACSPHEVPVFPASKQLSVTGHQRRCFYLGLFLLRTHREICHHPHSVPAALQKSQVSTVKPSARHLSCGLSHAAPTGSRSRPPLLLSLGPFLVLISASPSKTAALSLLWLENRQQSGEVGGDSAPKADPLACCVT